MPMLPRIKATLRVLLRRDEVERDLDDELHSMLEILTEEKIRCGRSPEQARREAWIELEGVEQVKARVREERHGGRLDILHQDVRYVLRTLRRSPGFTLVAVATLAIGIGATTALFSVLDAVLLRGLPYQEPDRLVAGIKTIDGRTAGPVSRVDYFDYRELGSSFSDLALILSGSGRLTIRGEGQPELASATWTTWNLFQTLGVQPLIGRSFVQRDEAQGDAGVVMISYGLWQRRFAGAAGAVGSVVRLDSTPVTIIGVLPQGFHFLYEVDVWALIDREGPFDSSRDQHSHFLVGRLAPGVSFESAQGEMDTIAAQLARQYPDANRGKGLRLMGLRDFMVAQARPSLMLLMATAGLVLLIACGNVSGLLLARGQRRLPEMAMRTALGASRRRLFHQLLTESVILTMLAGLTGVGVAYLLLAFLVRILPLGDPGVPKPGMDGGALLFALAISVFSGLLVGTIPALRSTAVNLAQRLRTGTRASQGVHGSRLRNALVVTQVALSILMLIGSGLLARSLANLASVELGFEPENVLAATVQIQSSDHPTPNQRSLVFSSLLEDIEALPGVVSAAFVSKLPIASTATDWPIWPAEQPRPANEDAHFALARWVSPGYFATLAMPLARGRDIADSDIPGARPVVVVTEAVASTLFPDRDPVGQRVGLGWFNETFEIVGIVGNARINGLRRQFDSAFYLSAAQTDVLASLMGFEVTSLSLVARTTLEPELLLESVRNVIRRADRNAALVEPTTMTSIIDDNLAGFRTVLISLGLLSILALLLTALGLYGVLAYQVSQRRNELGIRAAVGASPTNLVGLVVRHGFTLVAVGLLLGMAGALPATRLLQQMLFGIEPLDVSTFLAAAAFLALVGLLACLVPAWRATRVNLVEVLHRD